MDKLCQPADLSGQIVLEERLGFSGGHGDVRQGTLTTRNGEYMVAVKVLRPPADMRGDPYKFEKKLRREIQVWKRLDHDNIVPLLGTTTHFGPSLVLGPASTGMVSPWMENGNLITFMATKNLSLCDRLQILCDVAAGLTYLHSKNIIHGDLTGANVLINDTGKACLIDFGLSFIKVEFEGTSYWSSSVGGAMRWRAPELLPPMKGAIRSFIPNLTSACDIYSFGSVMLHVMSDMIPYYNVVHTAYVLLELHHGNAPERPPSSMLTDGYWEYITVCWGDTPTSRPPAEMVYKSVLDFLDVALSLLAI